MSPSDKEKICPHCEGRIALDANICPYCASDQVAGAYSQSFQTPLFQNQSLEDSLTSLYTPPYQGKRPQFSAPQEEAPIATEQEYEIGSEEEEPSYQQASFDETRTDPFETIQAAPEVETSKSPLVPTLLLMGGANLGLLGLLQLFFSKNGIFRLEWNAHYWFLYLLACAPLIYFGYKRLPEG